MIYYQNKTWDHSVIYSYFGYIRHYIPVALLLCYDNIKNQRLVYMPCLRLWKGRVSLSTIISIYIGSLYQLLIFHILCCLSQSLKKCEINYSMILSGNHSYRILRIFVPSTLPPDKSKLSILRHYIFIIYYL